eukprot:5282010-Amphidinium_carterae.1
MLSKESATKANRKESTEKEKDKTDTLSYADFTGGKTGSTTPYSKGKGKVKYGSRPYNDKGKEQSPYYNSGTYGSYNNNTNGTTKEKEEAKAKASQKGHTTTITHNNKRKENGKGKGKGTTGIVCYHPTVFDYRPVENIYVLIHVYLKATVFDGLCNYVDYTKDFESWYYDWYDDFKQDNMVYGLHQEDTQPVPI